MSLKTIPERLVPLKLPPGLAANGTVYQNKNRWYNAQLVRFHEDMTMPVGGWKNVLLTGGANVQVTGAPRGALAYVADSGTRHLAVGTPTKAYDYSDGVLTDITPAGFTSGQTDGGYATGAYGAGLYGAGPWGSGTGGVTLKAADTWQFDNFGQILVACFTADGRILQSTTGAQFTVVDANAPTGCLGVVVTPERFVVALGGQLSGAAAADARLLTWPAQGALSGSWPTQLAPTSVSDLRGSWKLQSRGRLMAGRRTRTETLIWTDAELYAMVFVGPGIVYSVQQRGAACGLIAPNAIAMVGDVAYWMGFGKFHVYNGVVSDMSCDVLDKVFSSAANLATGTQLNTAQRSKVCAIVNSTFHEITWFYPSMLMASGAEPDRYVTYNYLENHWTAGSLNRAAGVDRDVYDNPLWLDSNGFLYEHEVGSAMPGIVAGSPYPPPFLESGPMELMTAYGPYMVPTPGDVVFRIERYLPDEGTLGDLKTTIFVTLTPPSRTLAAGGPLPTEQVIGPFTHTGETGLRATGRQMRLRHDQVNAVSWRLGISRVGLVPGGLR